MEVFLGVLELAQDSALYLLGLLVGVAAALRPALTAQLVKYLAGSVPAVVWAFLRVPVQMWLDTLADKGIAAAEEYGARIVKETVDKGKAAVPGLDSKLDRARAFIKSRVPDFLFSDAEIDMAIDAALYKAALGASKGIQIGVRYIEEKLPKVE